MWSSVIMAALLRLPRRGVKIIAYGFDFPITLRRSWRGQAAQNARRRHWLRSISGRKSMRRFSSLRRFAICAVPAPCGASACANNLHLRPPLPPTTPYGAPITLDQAKRAADGAEAEAKKRNSTMAIAIVEPSGDLVYFRRMDGTQYSVSQDCAVEGDLGCNLPPFYQELPRAHRPRRSLPNGIGRSGCVRWRRPDCCRRQDHRSDRRVGRS